MLEPISSTWQISQHLITSQTLPKADYSSKEKQLHITQQHLSVSKAAEASPGSRSPCPGDKSNAAHGTVLALRPQKTHMAAMQRWTSASYGPTEQDMVQKTPLAPQV